jgi:hypothetical protein
MTRRDADLAKHDGAGQVVNLSPLRVSMMPPRPIHRLGTAPIDLLGRLRAPRRDVRRANASPDGGDPGCQLQEVRAT